MAVKKKAVCIMRKPRTIPMEPEWKKWLTDKTARLLAASPQLRPLHDKLLSFGGECVCLPVVEEDLVQLLNAGKLFEGRGSLLKKGRACRCHSNSAYLWDVNRDVLSLLTGYALSADGVWRQHTWCVFKGRNPARVVETTEKRLLYFGYRLTAKESRQFLRNNP